MCKVWNQSSTLKSRFCVRAVENKSTQNGRHASQLQPQPLPVFLQRRVHICSLQQPSETVFEPICLSVCLWWVSRLTAADKVALIAPHQPGLEPLKVLQRAGVALVPMAVSRLLCWHWVSAPSLSVSVFVGVLVPTCSSVFLHFVFPLVLLIFLGIRPLGQLIDISPSLWLLPSFSLPFCASYLALVSSAPSLTSLSAPLLHSCSFLHCCTDNSFLSACWSSCIVFLV